MFDLAGKDAFEVVINLAGVFQSIAVDQQRWWLGARVIGVALEVREEVVNARDYLFAFSIVSALLNVTGYIFKYLFGDGGVVANKNEDRRRILHFQLSSSARLEGMFSITKFVLVVFVELPESGFDDLRESWRFFG